MPKLLDLTGQRFGKLVVIELRPERRNKNAVWFCRCDCGQGKVAVSADLRTGRTSSCGCLRREVTTKRNKVGRPRRPEAPCIEASCERIADIKGLCRRHYDKQWRLGHPKKPQGHLQRLRKYGLTQQQFDELIAKQSGVCAICANPPTARGLFIDHDHRCCPGQSTCGKCLRGLLCSNCNFLIGLAQEDPRRLQGAVEYLLTWN